MSYNVEMTEATGGTFWKAYTPGQIAGTEEFPLQAASLTESTTIELALLCRALHFVRSAAAQQCNAAERQRSGFG